MERFYSHDLKCIIQQIDKRVARNLFNEGYEIFMHPSNMRFDNMWQHPCPCSKKNSFTDNFDYLCHDFAYYNCDSERGRYIHFFVKYT